MGPIVEYIKCNKCDSDIPIAIDANDGGGNVFTYCSKCGQEYAVSVAIKIDLKSCEINFR